MSWLFSLTSTKESEEQDAGVTASSYIICTLASPGQTPVASSSPEYKFLGMPHKIAAELASMVPDPAEGTLPECIFW